MLKLRPYQQEIIDAVRAEAMAGKKKIIMVLPTGSGKTACLFEMSRLAVEKGGKVLLVVHRRDLAFQTVDKFREYGMEAGIIMSGVETNLSRPVQIASVWTYKNRLDLAQKEFNRFFIDASMILLDECHKSLSKTYENVLSNYENKLFIGVTATPCLGSGAAMGSMYDSLVDKIPISRLIEEKYLVSCIYYGGTTADLRGLKTVRGDWDSKELGERSDKPELIGDIVSSWFRLASDRQTITFSVNRKHGKHLYEAFKNKGVSVAYLDAHSPDELRAEVLKDFAERKVQMIVNVALFQEFLDAPITSCVVMAKCTKSLGLWRQCVGRSLRPHPESGKTESIVIDHGGCCQLLGFIEEPVEWTLEGKKAYRAKKSEKKEKPLFECEMCRSMHRQHVCPQCGYKIKDYGKKVAALDAELVELGKTKKPKPTMAEKQRFYQMLEHERRRLGYNPGWGKHKFREKFGVWPNLFGDLGPIEPERDVLNWIKHQNIKFHYRKKKRVDNDSQVIV